MNKLKIAKVVALAAGLSVMAPLCVGMAKLGQYSIEEMYQDPKVVALVDAAWRGDAERVAKAVAEGADVNMVGKGGATPLMWALKNKSYVGVEALLQTGADPNYYNKEHDLLSPMALVSGGDEPKMLELLLKYGGNPNNPNGKNFDDRPLAMAASEGRLANVKILLSAGADLNAHDEYGESAATATIALGKFEVLAYLLVQGFSYNLESVARRVARLDVPDDSEAQQWKLKVNELLKARGVKIPEQQN
ncbi:ankyrin repeat domain-containing protein [Vibrio cholerae]|uniref:ankyrin repeat domain-containing protein n=1 Tax=Vibrio cholerae TaxID=666 RepID=UPI0027390AC5|nr:ankyrin repeat domain-containing protein [Vibrio cholerae]MDP4494394.1 ankyrin repeat domain-containing protein [Vibrio cholerae]WLP80139.1 ankyrin repeat domain-containing protein [Vibrio cholerae]